MKTMWMAGLAAAALSLTALGQQRAAAQCCPSQCQRGGDITFNVGVTFGLHWTPCCGHWVPDCPTCGYAPPPCGYAPPPYGYPPPPYGYRPFQPPQPTAAAAPNPPAANPAKGPPSGLENVGYNYGAGYGPYYGYNYGYMYGVPPYQAAPDYWYGR